MSWLGGGGMAERDMSWLGGGGIAEQDMSWLGGGGIAERDRSVRGGGGMTEPARVVLPAPDSIELMLRLYARSRHCRSRENFRPQGARVPELGHRGAAGAGAPVIGCRPQDSLLVVGYIEGRTFTASDVAAAANIPRIAVACRPAPSVPPAGHRSRRR